MASFLSEGHAFLKVCLKKSKSSSNKYKIKILSDKRDDVNFVYQSFFSFFLWLCK